MTIYEAHYTSLISADTEAKVSCQKIAGLRSITATKLYYFLLLLVQVAQAGV